MNKNWQGVWVGVGLLMSTLLGGTMGAGAQSPSPAAHRTGHDGLQKWRQDLSLNDEQARQLAPILKGYHQQRKQIQDDANQKILAVLTPDQQAQLKQAETAGARPHQAMKSLKLTKEQRVQIRSLHQEAQQQVQTARAQVFTQTKAFLTPDQESQFEQLLPPNGNKGNNKTGPAPATSPAPADQ